jgi:flagellar basal-body rod protein FlgG
LPGITVPNDARGVTINDAGEVLVKLDGQVAEANVGQLQIAAFANEAGLEAIGGNMFLESPASGAAIAGVANSVGYGKIMQGFLEASNVNVVSEITSLITAQRAYEMNSKVIKTTDEMMQTTSQVS